MKTKKSYIHITSSRYETRHHLRFCILIYHDTVWHKMFSGIFLVLEPISWCNLLKLPNFFFFLLVLIHVFTHLGIISTLLMTIYEKSHYDGILWKYLPASPWQYCRNVDDVCSKLLGCLLLLPSHHLWSVFEQILKYQDIYYLSPSPILSFYW